MAMRFFPKKIIFLVSAISVLDSSAIAADFTGYIQLATVQQEGAALINQGSATTGSWPACATLTRFAVSTATPQGQAIYATILTALKTHTPVTIHGKGNCDVWGDSESIEYLAAAS